MYVYLRNGNNYLLIFALKSYLYRNIYTLFNLFASNAEEVLFTINLYNCICKSCNYYDKNKTFISQNLHILYFYYFLLITELTQMKVTG